MLSSKLRERRCARSPRRTLAVSSRTVGTSSRRSTLYENCFKRLLSPFVPAALSVRSQNQPRGLLQRVNTLATFLLLRRHLVYVPDAPGITRADRGARCVCVCIAP